MEFYQLRYFVAVAETLNVTAAARILNVSQPPVTRAIHALEEEIGFALLTRSTKGVLLTATGEEFLNEARKTLAQAQRALERTRAAGRGQRGVLQVGYFGSSIFSIVPGILKRFSREVPDVQVVLRSMSKTDQVEALRGHRLDIGFARYYLREPDLNVDTIGSERLLAAFPRAWLPDERDAITIDRLAEIPMILFPREGRPNFADEVLRLLANAGVTVPVAQIVDDSVSALGCVASEMGCCIAPETIATVSWPGVVFVRVAGLDAEIPTNILCRSTDLRPATHAFLDVARAMKREDLSRRSHAASS